VVIGVGFSPRVLYADAVGTFDCGKELPPRFKKRAKSDMSQGVFEPSSVLAVNDIHAYTCRYLWPEFALKIQKSRSSKT
jgi:hypothetical protein